MMNVRENRLRALRFDGPEWIPVSCWFNASCWHHYEHEALYRLIESHPRIFPWFERPEGEYRPHLAPWQRAGEPFRDCWGSLWETSDDGITGAVTQHPLEDWAAFEGYLPPDPVGTDGRLPEGQINRQARHDQIQQQRARGEFTAAGLPHGHTYLRLIYLRGYENLTFDMTDDEPRLRELIGMVESVNLYHIRRCAALGVDMITFPEDLGMQVGPMLSPEHFRKFIKPVYRRLLAPAHEAGAVRHMHSDGDIRALAEDLIDLGLHCLNVQDLVNGLDWIRDHLKGRVAVDLDIDRQQIIRAGSPGDVRDHVREAVDKLAAPEGGLMLRVDLYPNIPLANIAALLEAIEECGGGP
mgnify:CR=1 FL=1